MKRLAPFLAALITACGAPSGGSSPGEGGSAKALEIVSRADSAASSVRSVAYDFSFYGTGELEGLAPFSGSAILEKGPGGGPPLMFVHFLPDTLESGQATPDLTFTTDSETAWMLDMSSGYLVSGLISEGGEDILQPTATAAMMEFVIGGPFQAEMAADTLRYEGIDTVGGTECDVVYVVYADGAGRARWHFGVADALPRRVERYDPTGAVSGAQVLELSNLQPGVGMDPADLVLTAPDDSFKVEVYRAVLEAGAPAPDWSLTSAAGEVVNLSGLRDTVVVLDFWATWCGPCAAAIPSLQALHEEMAGRPVKVFGLNVWENGDPVSFMEDLGVTYPILTGADSVADLYLVTAIPTFYVIGGDGRVRLARRGFEPGTEEALRSSVLEALAEIGR